MRRVSFKVLGKPQPAGSKQSFALYSHGQPIMKAGRVIVNTVDANKHAKPFKQEVAALARAQMAGRDLWNCPVRLCLVFVLARPAGHYRTGKNAHLLAKHAQPFPTVKPDVGKLARGVEDALTGIVYRDDVLIHTASLRKRYARANEPAHTKVWVVSEPESVPGETP